MQFISERKCFMKEKKEANEDKVMLEKRGMNCENCLYLDIEIRRYKVCNH